MSTIERLVAYRNAGADCLYAPGLATVEQIRTVVDAVDAPVNVLAWPNGPTVAEIAEAGARRVSVGGALASHAYASAMAGARELLDSGTTTFRSVSLRPDDRTALG
ncbi:MAG: isocitrate lyase/phosphoenolpyruvate mutase family protein [Ilumatobacter fluminis]